MTSYFFAWRAMPLHTMLDWQPMFIKRSVRSGIFSKLKVHFSLRWSPKEIKNNAANAFLPVHTNCHVIKPCDLVCRGKFSGRMCFCTPQMFYHFSTFYWVAVIYVRLLLVLRPWSSRQIIPDNEVRFRSNHTSQVYNHLFFMREAGKTSFLFKLTVQN
jgi:hypothetical protein